jgi:hypothetical protein
MMTGAEVHAQIDALVANQEGGGFVGYGEEHMLTHKLGLTRLPYFDGLLLPHNIDVMHTEKNVARHFGEPSWKLKSQRTTLRLEWTWQHYAIDQSKRCNLLEVARHGKGLRLISS